TPPAAAPIPPVNVVGASTLPRAGFWIRLAASALDIIIVALVANLIPHQLRPNLLLMFAVYCALLWGLKGTTVGGIICGLKLVRLDERPLDWPTAIVRVLGGFLSLVAAGIGFIWVAFDDQKQSWHDKIAGTTIVLVPKGVSLV
ncbi:MAG TPA: RDD family protein, partial [Opitutus sp.]|nr:RDD family protein [Opitutus sp.]